MSNTILGLDIESDGISAVLVRKEKKQSRIKAFEFIARKDLEPSFPREADQEIPADDFIEYVRRALEAIAEKINIGGSYCIVSLPAERLSFRNIHLPFKNIQKIRQILPFELEPLLPLPVDELEIDFTPLPAFSRASAASSNTTSEKETPQTSVLTTCVEKTFLSSLLETLASAGVKPDRMVPGGIYPFALAFSPFEDKSRLLFVDVADSICHLCFVNEGYSCLIRSFPLSPDLQERMQMIQSGIRGTLLALQEQPDMSGGPEGIVLTGDVSGQETAALEKMFELPVRQADVNKMLAAVQPPVSAAEYRYLKMSRAYALCRLHITGVKVMNLYKTAFDAGRMVAEHKKGVMTAGILAAGLMILLGINGYLTFSGLNQRIAQLDRGIRHVFETTFPDVKTIVDPLQQMRVKVAELRKEAVLGSDGREKMLVIDILNEVSRRIPPTLDMELTRMDISPDSLLISGETADFNSVDAIKNRLAAYRSFNSAEISSATMDKSGNRVRFKIKIDL